MEKFYNQFVKGIHVGKRVVGRVYNTGGINPENGEWMVACVDEWGWSASFPLADFSNLEII